MAVNQSTISGNDLGIVISTLVARNYYAQVSTPVVADGVGVVNENYNGDTNNTLTVGIHRVKRPTITTRTLGGITNGGYVNTDDEITLENEDIALVLNKVIDPRFAITLLQSGSVNFNVAYEIADNVANIMREQVDTITIAEMFNKSFAYGAALSVPYSNISLINLSTSTDPLSVLRDISQRQTSLLANDYDKSTPFVGRSIVGTHTFYNTLISKNGISIVGSDKAFLTQVKGVEGYMNDGEIQDSSYKGIIFGFDYFIAPDSFFPAQIGGSIYGIATHYIATTRAMTPAITKLIDYQKEAGMLLQYLQKWNVLCFRPYMVFPIVSSDWKAETLAKPTTLANVAGTVSWTGDTNAVSYQVYIDGVANGSPITTTSKDISTSIVTPATYKITVKALGTGTIYADSALSAELSIVVSGT